MEFRIISFYTVNTPYAEEIKKLEKSLLKYKYKYFLYPVNSMGSWDLNTKQKTNIILQSFKDFTEDVFIYVDADAIVQNKINIEDFTADLGVCYLSQGNKKKRELLSGTIFLRNLQIVERFIECWQNKCFNPINKKKWDQKILQEMVESENNKGIKIQEMNAKYCKIFNYRGRAVDDTIVHYQASRRFKKIVSKKIQ